MPRIQTLMTADLVSLVLVLLIALAGQHHFGTPDPVDDFLVRLSHCLPVNSQRQPEGFQAQSKDICRVSVAKEASAIDSSNLVTCERIQGRPKTNHSSCGETVQRPRIELDFVEGVVRLPGLFEYGTKKFDVKTNAYLPHVTRIIGRLLADHMENPTTAHLSTRLRHAELFLVLIDGHSDHSVRRVTARVASNSGRDDNVTLAMTRARLYAEELEVATQEALPTQGQLESEPSIIPTSFGCHRPILDMGLIKSAPPVLVHDSNCYQPSGSSEDSQGLVNVTEKQIKEELFPNRRVEVRLVFRFKQGGS